jgi:hypothetical protein
VGKVLPSKPRQDVSVLFPLYNPALMRSPRMKAREHPKSSASPTSGRPAGSTRGGRNFHHPWSASSARHPRRSNHASGKRRRRGVGGLRHARQSFHGLRRAARGGHVLSSLKLSLTILTTPISTTRRVHIPITERVSGELRATKTVCLRPEKSAPAGRTPRRSAIAIRLASESARIFSMSRAR